MEESEENGNGGDRQAVADEKQKRWKGASDLLQRAGAAARARMGAIEVVKTEPLGGDGQG